MYSLRGIQKLKIHQHHHHVHTGIRARSVQLHQNKRQFSLSENQNNKSLVKSPLFARSVHSTSQRKANKLQCRDNIGAIQQKEFFSSKSNKFSDSETYLLSATNDSRQSKYFILMVLMAALMMYTSLLSAESNEDEVDEGQIVPETPEPQNKKPDPEELNREAVKELQKLRGTDISDVEIVLYQYEACPFCSKVRAFLNYYRVPYKVVEVDPIFKAELKKASVDYRKVPVVFVNGIRLVDSYHIIGNIHDVFFSDQEHHVRSEEEEYWRKWVDNRLVHTLPPNIYRTPSEALQAFDYIASKNNFSTLQRLFSKYAGSTAMYAVSKRLKKRHGIEDEREALYDCAREFIDALGDRPFLGGDKPNLADLSIFGALNSIEGLDTYRDLVYQTDIEFWYDRMRRSVGSSVRIKL